MSQKRHRSDSSPSWTIFTATTADSNGDPIPTNPHDSKHSRASLPSPTLSSSSAAGGAQSAAAAAGAGAAAITCYLPPSCGGGAEFATHELFESHYALAHTNRCVECGRNFPSGRFLELHIAEWHDPLGELRRERGEKGYACFVTDCERLCSTPQKRRRHVIDKHHFPREYNWGIVQWGIDNHTTLLTRAEEGGARRRRRGGGTAGEGEGEGEGEMQTKTKTKPKQLGGKNPSPGKTQSPGRERKRPAEEAEKEEVVLVKGGKVEEVEMADVVGAMGAMKLVPMSVRFGRRGR